MTPTICFGDAWVADSISDSDPEAQAIAVIAMEMWDEGRLDEGEEWMVSLLETFGAPAVRLFVDFSNCDAEGHLRLNLTGTQGDLTAQSLVLRERGIVIG